MDMDKVKRWSDLYDRRKHLEAELAEVMTELGELGPEIIEMWADDGVTTMRLGDKTLYVHRDVRAGKLDDTVQTADIVKALQAADFGDLVEPKFNWQTLSSLVRELTAPEFEGGELQPLPDVLATVIHPIEQFSMRKRNRKS